MKLSKKTAFTLFIFLTVIIVILVYSSLLNEETSNDESIQSNSVDYGSLDEVIFDVVVADVELGELVQTINANGRVRALQEVEIKSSISGTVTDVNIYDGKEVEKTDILVSLDDRKYQIELKEADDQILSSRVEYGFLIKDIAEDTTHNEEAARLQAEIQKLEVLKSQNRIEIQDYLEKKEDLEMKLIFSGAKKEDLILNKSGYNKALSARERALLNIEFTKITAPFPGVIGEVDLVVGERINSDYTICKLFDTKKLVVEVGVLENEVNKISEGNSVEVIIPALNNQKYSAKVKRISPFIDPESKTCRVIIVMDNSDNEVKPGMFARLEIETKTLNKRILIPKEALLVRDKRDLVFTVENDSIAKWKYVDIGEENNKYYEILSGVKPGEKVVVQGHYNIAHDSMVRVSKQ